MMILSPETPVKQVEDYEFQFVSGAQPYVVSLDLSAGDKADFSEPGLITFTYAEKTSLDGSVLPAEEVVIFSTHVLVMRRRTREM